MRRADQMEERLRKAFLPDLIEIIDESENHRGHSGYRDGGESHFRIRMRSAALAQMTRLERHRAVHAALGADLVAQIHALSLDLTDG